MPATRRVYDEEFKKNAVKQSYTSQKTIAETAKELGVSMRALREWRQYYTAEGEKTSLALREEETEALLLDLAELRIPKLEDVINEVKWRILQKAYQEYPSDLKAVKTNDPDRACYINKIISAWDIFIKDTKTSDPDVAYSMYLFYMEKIFNVYLRIDGNGTLLIEGEGRCAHLIKAILPHLELGVKIRPCSALDLLRKVNNVDSRGFFAPKR